ncbi:rho GTPase-activating protein 20 [Ambystoma mexicanum]|uniref:rho GTPase-activating protein 20 n=1 Tax=Ambystoma mexicanum TaxID=8296 RepID=UPI0037E9536F
MDAMSPQQDSMGQQARSASLNGDCNVQGLPESKRKMKTLAQRRQSAPSLVLSKALNKSRTTNRENCISPISPETCPFLQSLTAPNRQFLMDGHVHLKTGLQTQERHLFLFSDVLVIAKSKSPTHFKFKQQVRLCEMWTASCMEEVCEGSTHPERSFVVGWPTTNCVATFSSPEQKEKWLSSLLSRIMGEKQNDHPKSLSLKIFAKDIGNGAHSKTVTITNGETVRDVIRLALQQFGVTGSEKDYQLWVISGKDDAPYPLIGHEHPYEIKMSHVRDALLQAHCAKDSILALDLHGTDRREQMPGEMRCQFILKPSRMAACQSLNDLSQKPFKRRRSIINWAFWRGPGPQLDCVPLSPTSSVLPGRLFGLPLSDICENDNLPKPVLDMLTFLYQEGPFTKGIFRRSANAKSCRELKDKLDCEAEVHLACESIFATASVFKDFLRNIPDSILSTKLCDNWISVLEHESREERISVIQRLMEQLPRANLLLLRYLLAVLHIIERHSQTNQMTAFNLAICIAPSMLWLPTTSSPEVESNFTKKVSECVQFLIENCAEIFGEDITTLFGNLSARCEGREDGSDLCSFQLIDSSYDSLDNELNDDAESALSDLATKRGPDNRSRDSVLTLSDCDLDQAEVEGIEMSLPPRSKPVRIFSGLRHKSASQEHSENGSLCSNTSGYSSTTVSDALMSSRRHRRCSEPIVGLLASKLSQLSGSHDCAARKTSCDAVMSHAEADYLKQLRSLQVEGQKLIDRSLTLGIDVNKGGSTRQEDETKDSSNQLLPPAPLRLNVCLRTSCSSLSSPGTSPSGSSMSSMDSAFSQLSDYSTFAPNEISTPLDCPFRLQRKAAEMSTDLTNSNPLCMAYAATEASCSIKQSINGSVPCAGNDSLEWPPQRSHGTRHPGSWLKSGASTMKNWSLRKKEKASKQDGKHNSGKMPASQPQNGSTDALEQHAFPEEKLSEGSMAVVIAMTPDKGECVPPPSSQGIEQFNSPPPCEDEAKEKKQMLHKRLTNQNILDKNGNGVKDTEHNMESVQSAILKDGGAFLIDKRHSQIPETVFYGQNVSLFSHTNKRQLSNMRVIEESQTLNSSCVLQSEGRGTCGKDSRTVLGRDARAASFKRNKVLPSNTNTEYKTTNLGIEKAFCVSPRPTNSSDVFFFQPDVNKCLQKSNDPAKDMVQNPEEWLKNCCTDNTFEESDQRFFAEESYV